MNNLHFFRRRKLKIMGWGFSLGVIMVAFMACAPRQDKLFQQGKGIYEQYCATCHGSQGEGVLYSLSVLNQSPLVLGDPKQMIAVILNGREGSGSMPGWKDKLSDQEVAAVATCLRQAWSNRAGAVTPEMVAAVRTP
jgi:mono/diheme cytochrome c family protein